MKANYKKMLSLAAIILAMGVTAAAGNADAAVTRNGHQYAVPNEEGAVKFNDDGTATVKWVCQIEGHTDTDTTTEKTTAKPVEQKFPCKPGTQIYTLTVDGKNYTSDAFEVAPKAEHKFDTDVEVVKEATCTEGGKVRENKKCSVCGEVEQGELKDTDALGHDWKITYERMDNVKVDEKGNATLIDKSKDGVYFEVKTCQNNKEHKEEKEIKVSASASSAEQGDTKNEYIDPSDEGKKDNVKIENGKVTLRDCTKDGKYKEVTYAKDGTTVLKEVEKTVKAGHTPADPVAEKISSTNITVELKDGKLVATNKSCAKEGTYDEVVYCAVCKKHEISRKTVTVAKSKKHTPATDKKYENDTATCKAAGKRDEITVCAICGDEISRKSVPSEMKQHLGLKPVVENEKKATAHHEGSYDSVVYCKWGGEEMTRTKVTTPATNPDKYTWAYKIEWSDEDAFVDSKRDEYIEKAPTATMTIYPTDDDLTAKEVKEKTEKVELDVTEDEKKAVVGDACHMSERTFVAKVDTAYIYDKDAKEIKEDAKASKPDLKVKETSSQAYNFKDKGYKGHKWSKYTLTVIEEPTTKKEGKAAYRRTCDVCGEVYDQYYEPIPKLDPETKETEKEETTKNEEETTKKDADTKKLIDIKDATIEGKSEYRGEFFNVPFTVTLNGKKLTENKDFVLTNSRKNNFRSVGFHTIKIAGIGNYTGKASGRLEISKADQKIVVSRSKKTFKANKLAKKAASFITTITKAHGKLTYKTSSKKITFKKTAVGTYKVTAKKGTKAGTYTITVRFKATKNYKAAERKITVTVK